MRALSDQASNQETSVTFPRSRSQYRKDSYIRMHTQITRQDRHQNQYRRDTKMQRIIKSMCYRRDTIKAYKDYYEYTF